MNPIQAAVVVHYDFDQRDGFRYIVTIPSRNEPDRGELPGGKRETSDLTLLDTMNREYAEEVGFPCPRITEMYTARLEVGETTRSVYRLAIGVSRSPVPCALRMRELDAVARIVVQVPTLVKDGVHLIAWHARDAEGRPLRCRLSTMARSSLLRPWDR